MITNIGKNLIGKYLIGNSTQYVSHIAIGSGAKPITSATAYSDYTLKTEMDFEMVRLPIISRSYINDKSTAVITNVAVTSAVNSVTFTATNEFVVGQLVIVTGISGATIGGLTATSFNQSYTVTSVASTGLTFTARPSSAITPSSNQTSPRTGTATGYVNKLSFTAELPLAERYEITELALWSDEANPIPSGVDSRNIFNFSRIKESWKYYLASSGDTFDITYSSSALDTGAPTVNANTNNIVFQTTPAIKAILTNSNNTFFDNPTITGVSETRLTRYERPRFLDDALIISANMSKFAMVSPTPSTTIPNDLDETLVGGNDYIVLSNIKIGDLDTNSTNDELVLAYSLINANAIPTTSFATIESINFMIQFETSTGNYARYHFKKTSPSATNRYQTIAVSLGDTTYSQKDSLFKWSDVTSAKIYASIQSDDGTQLTDYALALDGLSFVNKNNLNESNYGMVAYVPIKNTSATALVKESNTANLIEFRLILGGLNV
jgi:hypothetical protein